MTYPLDKQTVRYSPLTRSWDLSGLGQTDLDKAFQAGESKMVPYVVGIAAGSTLLALLFGDQIKKFAAKYRVPPTLAVIAVTAAVGGASYLFAQEVV